MRHTNIIESLATVLGSTATWKQKRNLFCHLVLSFGVGSASMARAQFIEPFQASSLFGPPDLAVVATAKPNVVYAGLLTSPSYETSTITIRVENRLTARPLRWNGGVALYGSNAGGITVKINAGKLLQIIPSFIAGGGFQCSASGQILTCLNGAIPAGSSVDIQFDVIAPQPVACSVNTTVEATVDPDQKIQEASEMNNTTGVNITLQTIC
jgi:hypothetical protein